MAPPPAELQEADEVEEVESDEYEVRDDDDDEDFRDEDEGEGDDDDDAADDGGDGKENLTALLVNYPGAEAGAVEEDDEDDEGYVPGGGVDPADEEVDGHKKDDALPGDAEEGVDDLVSPKVPGVSAIGIKRKTSGDEEEEEEAKDEDESEAKKAKV